MADETKAWNGRLAIGVGAGVGAGLGLGFLFDAVLLWGAIGVAVGVAVGVALQGRPRRTSA